MRRSCIQLVLMAVLLTGCATVAVDRAKDVSSAGVAYTQAVAAVIDLAIDAAIDADSESKVQSKPRKLPIADAAQADREKALKEDDETLITTVTLYTSLKRSVAAVEAYFRALQQLADGSTAEATENAVLSLAGRLNGINGVLDKQKNGAPRISEEQSRAIGGLSKIVAKEIHGAILAQALERDAATIERALVLQEKILKVAEGDISSKLEAASARFYTDQVVGPYKTGNIGSVWVDDRRAYLKSRGLARTIESVSAAEAAAKQMQTVWRRILSGEYSAKELTAILKDTEDLLSAVAVLKDANTKKK